MECWFYSSSLCWVVVSLSAWMSSSVLCHLVQLGFLYQWICVSMHVLLGSSAKSAYSANELRCEQSFSWDGLNFCSHQSLCEFGVEIQMEEKEGSPCILCKMFCQFDLLIHWFPVLHGLYFEDETLQTGIEDSVNSKTVWLTQTHKIQEAMQCTLKDRTWMRLNAQYPSVCWDNEQGVRFQVKFK